MNIELDTTNKVIKIKYQVLIKDLLAWLAERNIDVNEWKIESDVVYTQSYPITYPVYQPAYDPIQPPYDSPYKVYCSGHVHQSEIQ